MPRSVWLAVSTAALLSLAACGGHEAPPPAVVEAPPPTPTPPPPPAPPPEATSPDQQFIDQAAAGGLSEVDLGHLAEKQGTRRDVHTFGARMVSDHTRVDHRLMALANHLKMPPSAPPAPDQQAHDQLAQATGPDFDKQYINGQIQAHQDMIQLFEGEAKSGQNAQLKRFARETLPTLRHHLHEAEAIAKHLGG